MSPGAILIWSVVAFGGILKAMGISGAEVRRSPVSRAATVGRPQRSETSKSSPKEIIMKIRTLAVATAFATLLGTAALHAENMTTDHDRLNGYSRMTYNHISLSGGEEAAVAVQGVGNSALRVSVYDYNNNLIAHTSCRVDTCVVTWVANWNANFYVTVENLSSYATEYGFALRR
jgi:hypothetical protein